MIPFTGLIIEAIQFAAREAVPTILGMLIRRHRPRVETRKEDHKEIPRDRTSSEDTSG